MKIAVIGGGNMGGAIASGAVTYAEIAPKDIAISHPSDKIKNFFDKNGKDALLSRDNVQTVKDADLIVVAVKPWLMEQVIKELAPHIDAKCQMVASVAAGIKFETIRSWFDQNNIPTLFRIIPNTAITLGKSVTFIASDRATDAEEQKVMNLFKTMGSVFKVSENDMSAVTALASCGIAYAFKYIDASTKGGIEIGVDPNEAQQIVMKTVEGALAMLTHNGSEPQTEIDKVTTPGGITLKGLNAMQENGFTEAVKEGLKASK